MSQSNESAVKATQSSGAAFRTRDIAFIGIFGAIAAVLMYFEFPLPFAPTFYKIDFSEVPVLIGTFALGPIAGLLIELVKIVLHVLIKGTSTAFVGDFANFVVGAALLLPAGIIYNLKKSKKHALIGMLTGTLCMAFIGALMNAFVLLPAYAAAFGMPIESLVAMGTAVNKAVTNVFTFAVLCVVPFNLVKGVVVSVVTLILYKRVSGMIHKTRNS